MPETERAGYDAPVPAKHVWLALLGVVATLLTVGWLGTTDLGTPPPRHANEAARGVTPQMTSPVVAFHGSRVGYALVPDCVDAGSCSYRFWSTVDGGSSWRGYKAPVDPPAGNGTVGMAALGDGVLVETHDSRWFSRDGGRSWTPQPDKPDGSLDQLPASALVSTRCQDSACLATDVYLTLPDGTLTRLARSPDVTPIDHGWQRADGDTIRLSGLDRAGQPTIAVSDDRGREWHYMQVPTGPLRVSNTYVAASGDDLFVTVRGLRLGHAGEATGGPRTGTLMSTSDGGRTWSDPSPDLTDPTRACVLPDGRLLVLDGHSLKVSADRGQTYTGVPDVPPLRSLDDTGGAYVGLGTDGAYRMSTDGVTWHTLSLDSLG